MGACIIRDNRHYPLTVPNATETDDGAMSSADKTSLDQMVAAGGATALLDLEENDAMRPTPFVDETQTVDATTMNVALIEPLDDPSTILTIVVTVLAYDDLGRCRVVKQQASWKGNGNGIFTQFVGAAGLYDQTNNVGTSGWTFVIAQPGGVVLPNIELTGEAGRTIVWKIYSEIFSTP